MKVNQNLFNKFFLLESVLDPTCWAIINEERNTYSLVARKHEIFKLNQGYSVCSVQKVSIENEFDSIIEMSVSFNHRFLALYTNNGIVWMGTSNLEKKYCEFRTNQTEKPKQIEWILDSENYSRPDADAIVIAYPSLLLIVTVAGDSNMYSYDSVPFLIPEMDCVRILSNNEHEMLQKVPSCVNNIFAINSQKPSSYLFGAYQKYEVSNSLEMPFILHRKVIRKNLNIQRKKVINRMNIWD